MIEIKRFFLDSAHIRLFYPYKQPLSPTFSWINSVIEKTVAELALRAPQDDISRVLSSWTLGIAKGTQDLFHTLSQLSI